MRASPAGTAPVLGTIAFVAPKGIFQQPAIRPRCVIPNGRIQTRCVIPNARVFSSARRNLACSAIRSASPPTRSLLFQGVWTMSTSDPDRRTGDFECNRLLSTLNNDDPGLSRRQRLLPAVPAIWETAPEGCPAAELRSIAPVPCLVARRQCRFAGFHFFGLTCEIDRFARADFLGSSLLRSNGA